MKLQVRFSKLTGRFFANWRASIISLFLLGVIASVTLAMTMLWMKRTNSPVALRSASKPANQLDALGKPNESELAGTANTSSKAITTKSASPTKQVEDNSANPEFRTVPPTQLLDGETEGAGERRVDWFYEQRAYPAKTIPAEAGFRMREQLKDEKLA